MNKVYACADLHGMLPLWRQIQEFCDESDTIYVLGDAADRGPDSWETLKEILRDPRVKYVKGNHDVMMLDSWKSDWQDSYLWLVNGGQVTMDQMLRDPDYEKYLRELTKQPIKRVYERADGSKVHLTHAGFTILRNDFYPDDEDLIWDREHWFDSCDDENSNDWIVCGHTPILSSTMKHASLWAPMDFNNTYTVARSGHKICIDGGCFATGRIALLDLDTFEEKVFK